MDQADENSQAQASCRSNLFRYAACQSVFQKLVCFLFKLIFLSIQILYIIHPLLIVKQMNYSCAGVPPFWKNENRQSGDGKPLFRNKDTAQEYSVWKRKIRDIFPNSFRLQIASLNGHLCHIWRPACDLNGGQPRTH